jgi:hypothetical protein
MAMRWLLTVGAWAVVVALSGCDRTCEKLADRLCEQASLANDKNAASQCEAWRERTSRVPSAACAGALQRLDLQQ